MTDLLPLRVLQTDEVRAAVRRLAETIVDIRHSQAMPDPPLDSPDPSDSKAIKKLAKENPGPSVAELKRLDERIQVVVWEALQTVELPGVAGELGADNSGGAEDGPDGERGALAQNGEHDGPSYTRACRQTAPKYTERGDA